MYSSALLAAAIQLAVASVQTQIIVSLEACTFCDASALTVLLEAKAALGDRFTIVLPYAHPMRLIFDVTNLTEKLALLGDLEAALNATT